jgi:hypothetical protein
VIGRDGVPGADAAAEPGEDRRQALCLCHVDLC